MSCKRKPDKKEYERYKEEKKKFERSSSKHPFRSRTLKKAHRKKRQALKKKRNNDESRSLISLSSAKSKPHSSSFTCFKFQTCSSGRTTSLPLFSSTKPTFLMSNPFISQASKEGIANDMSSSSPFSSTQMSLYNRHVSGLNRSISSQIAESVIQDPIRDLTPIFVDYEQTIKDIREKYGTSATKPEAIKDSTIVCQQTVTASETLSSTKLPPKIKPLTEALRDLTSPLTPLGSNFTFNATPFPFKGCSSVLCTNPQKIFKGFQFNSSMATSSLAVVPSAARGLAAERKAGNTTSSRKPDCGKKQQCIRENKIPLVQGKDEYTPPEPGKTVVQEKDSFYTTKCKLFYLKNGSYADKGVGHLHLKPIPSSTKTQLLIRADNPLGLPLLNISLNPAMPVTKQGRNNISFSCVSNPPVDEKEPDKVVSMLIRVKTSEEAEQLLSKWEHKKKESN